LTRQTLAAILQGIRADVFSQYKTNPEDFIANVSCLINEQKATVIVEHLTYDTLADTHSIDIFTKAGKALKNTFTIMCLPILRRNAPL